jgi:hypothetical protein
MHMTATNNMLCTACIWHVCFIKHYV